MNEEPYIAYALFSKQWMASMDTTNTKIMFERLIEKLGHIERYELKSWATVVTVGTNNSSSYAYSFNVVRTKFNSEEQFRLLKEGDSIKIISYNVNSVGFR